MMATVGPLNTRNLLLFFGALKKSVELGERLLVEYQGAQASLKAMEHAVALAEQEAAEQAEQNQEQAPDDHEEDESTGENPDESSEDAQAAFIKAFDIRKLN